MFLLVFLMYDLIAFAKKRLNQTSEMTLQGSDKTRLILLDPLYTSPVMNCGLGKD